MTMKDFSEIARRNALLAELVCQDEIVAEDVSDLMGLLLSTSSAIREVQQAMANAPPEAGNLQELRVILAQLRATQDLINRALKDVLVYSGAFH